MWLQSRIYRWNENRKTILVKTRSDVIIIKLINLEVEKRENSISYIVKQNSFKSVESKNLR